MSVARHLAVVLLALSVAGCASTTIGASDGDGSVLQSVAGTVAGAVRGRKAAAPADMRLTRAMLATVGTPVDLVTVERTGAKAVIAKLATNGAVETWSSLDNIRLSFRQGILVATRGLGSDLMTAAVPAASHLRQAGATHRRSHTTLRSDDVAVPVAYECRVSDVGAERLVVVERAYTTRHLRESCTGTESQFVNDFWFQTGGKLRKSRQWVSPGMGYVVIEHLSDG